MYQAKRESVLKRESDEVEGKYAALTVIGAVIGLTIAMLIWNISYVL